MDLISKPISNSSRYIEYLALPDELIEPDKAEEILPQELHSLLPFLDPYIDTFQISFKTRKGKEIIADKEGFRIKSGRFWVEWKKLNETENLKYITTNRSINSDWYLISRLKRRR